MFYQYNQNNSGGSFVFDKDMGITHHVVIEAESADDADRRAEEVGLYFNGCEEGRDCSCCGDRWHPTYGEGDSEPLYYGMPVNKATGAAWMKPNKDIAVHYLDGRIEWYDIMPSKKL